MGDFDSPSHSLPAQKERARPHVFQPMAKFRFVETGEAVCSTQDTGDGRVSDACPVSCCHGDANPPLGLPHLFDVLRKASSEIEGVTRRPVLMEHLSLLYRPRAYALMDDMMSMTGRHELVMGHPK